MESLVKRESPTDCSEELRELRNQNEELDNELRGHRTAKSLLNERHAKDVNNIKTMEQELQKLKDKECESARELNRQNKIRSEVERRSKDRIKHLEAKLRLQQQQSKPDAATMRLKFEQSRKEIELCQKRKLATLERDFQRKMTHQVTMQRAKLEMKREAHVELEQTIQAISRELDESENMRLAAEKSHQIKSIEHEAALRGLDNDCKRCVEEKNEVIGTQATNLLNLEIQLSKADQKINTVEQSRDRALTELDTANLKISVKFSEISRLTEAMSAREQIIGKQTQTITANLEKTIQLQNDLDASECRGRQFKKLSEQQDEELQACRQLIEKLNKVTAEKYTAVAKLQEEKKALEQQNIALQKNVTDFGAESERLRAEVNSGRRDLERTTSEHVQEMARQRQACDLLKNQLSSATNSKFDQARGDAKQLGQVEVSLKLAEDNVSVLREKCNKLEATNRDLASTANSSKLEIELIQTKLSEAIDEKVELQVTLKDHQSREKILREREMKLSTQKKELKIAFKQEKIEYRLKTESKYKSAHQKLEKQIREKCQAELGEKKTEIDQKMAQFENQKKSEQEHIQKGQLDAERLHKKVEKLTQDFRRAIVERDQFGEKLRKSQNECERLNITKRVLTQKIEDQNSANTRSSLLGGGIVSSSGGVISKRMHLDEMQRLRNSIAASQSGLKQRYEQISQTVQDKDLKINLMRRTMTPNDEHLAVVKNLANVEKELSELQQKLSTQIEAFSKRGRSLDKRKAELSRVKTELGTTTAELDSVKQQLSDNASKLEEGEAHIIKARISEINYQKLSRETAALRADKTSLEKQLQTQCDESTAEIEALQTSVDALHTSHEKLKRQLTERKNQAKQFKKKCSELDRISTESQQQHHSTFTEISGRLADETVKCIDLEKALKEKDGRIETLLAEEIVKTKMLQERIAKNLVVDQENRDLRELIKKFSEKHQKSAELVTQLQALQRLHATCRLEVEELDTKLAHKSADLKLAEAEMLKTHQRNEELEATIADGKRREEKLVERVGGLEESNKKAQKDLDVELEINDQDLDRAEKRIRELELTVKDWDRRYAALEKELETINLQLTQQRQLLKQSEERSAAQTKHHKQQLEKHHKQQSHLLKQSEERSAGHVKQLETQTTENQGLLEKCQTITKELAQQKQETAQSESALTNLKTEYDRYREFNAEKLKEIEEKLKLKHEKLMGRDEEAETATNRIVELEESIVKLRQETREYKMKYTNQKSELELVTANAAAAKRRIEELSEDQVIKRPRYYAYDEKKTKVCEKFEWKHESHIESSSSAQPQASEPFAPSNRTGSGWQEPVTQRQPLLEPDSGFWPEHTANASSDQPGVTHLMTQHMSSSLATYTRKRETGYVKFTRENHGIVYRHPLNSRRQQHLNVAVDHFTKNGRRLEDGMKIEFERVEDQPMDRATNVLIVYPKCRLIMESKIGSASRKR